MATQSWSVDFDGPVREIVAETDPQSGRTAIRVDGRMAARPMAREEQERTFAVGSVTYVLRRNGAELDLDIAPAHLQAPPQASPARTGPGTTKTPAAQKKPVPVFKIVSSIVLTLVLSAAVRWGFRYFTYMSVPWQSYTHDDRRFRLNFAGVPEKSSRNAGMLRTMQLKSSYEGHFYILEFVEFPELIPDDKQGAITDDAFNAIVKAEKWKLIKREWGNRGLNFIAEVPRSSDWSEGTARGSIIPHRDRIYIVYAFVPRGEALGWDVGEFLRSLELA